MSDLTSLEQRFRAANPVPDPSNPPMAAASAAAALLEFEARSVDMQTEERPTRLEPEGPRNLNRLIIGAAAAAVTVVLIILVATGILGGDTEVIEPSAELFCELDETLELVPPGDMNPELAAKARADLAALVAAAPLEIRDDVEADVNQWLAMLDLWQEADWDRSLIDTAELGAAQEAWFRTDPGDTRGDDWIEANCSS